jgi:hypothetical protein
VNTTIPTTVQIGQVWQKGDRTALVVDVDEGIGARYCVMRTVIDGAATGRRSRVLLSYSLRACRPDGYTFQAASPVLRCISPASASLARDFLASKGINDAVACREYVAAPLSVSSVMRFAEDALANGWADDHECARMIGDLG